MEEITIAPIAIKYYFDFNTLATAKVFEVLDLMPGIEEAEAYLSGYKTVMNHSINQVDEHGLLTSFSTTILTFKGRLTKEEVMQYVEQNKDDTWSNDWQNTQPEETGPSLK